MKNKLIRGDAINTMKKIGDNTIDAVIADPPYNTTACQWDKLIPFDLMWDQLNRITKPNAPIILFGSEPFSSKLRMSNIKNYKYDWVWNKKLAGNGILAKRQPLKIHELVHVFNTKIYYPIMETRGKIRSKDYSGIIGSETVGKVTTKAKTTYNNTYYPQSIVEFVLTRRGRLHPTQKPLELVEYLVKTYTKEGELVLDFCMGSGTLPVACINTNRDYIGIDKERKYIDITKKRIKDMKGMYD